MSTKRTENQWEHWVYTVCVLTTRHPGRRKSIRTDCHLHLTISLIYFTPFMKVYEKSKILELQIITIKILQKTFL